ncbi:MAG: hypothetical protein RJA49_2048 [Actinomycetota bacterium]|jgi:hypothetical protein
MLDLIARSRKAIIGGVVAAAAGYAAKRGIDLSDTAANVLTAVLTLASVWLVPNKAA